MRGLAVAGAALLWGCTSTALDVTRELDVDAGHAHLDASPPSTDGQASDAGCEPAEPPLAGGVYRIERASAAECLTLGARTMVGSAPAFGVQTGACTDGNEQHWLVIASPPGAVQLRQARVEYNLDVQFGQAASGTPLVLFAPHNLDNQRFALRPRSAGVFELSPGNALRLCVSARPNQLEIWPCSASDSGQAWSFVSTDCR